MKPVGEQSEVCSTMEHFSDLLTRETVTNVIPLSDDLLDVRFEKKIDNRRDCRSALLIGSYILSHSRQLLHEKITFISSNYNGFNLIMINSDAVLFSITAGQCTKKMGISNRVGEFKHQIKDSKHLLSFHGLSPNAYHICYVSQENRLLQVSKLSGFSLRNFLAKPLDEKDFEKLLECAFSGIGHEIPIKQIRMHRSVFGYTEKEFIFFLRAKIDQKRINLSNYKTLAYGFREDDLEIATK